MDYSNRRDGTYRTRLDSTQVKRKAMEKAGFVPVMVYVKPDDVGLVKAYAAKLREKK